MTINIRRSKLKLLKKKIRKKQKKKLRRKVKRLGRKNLRSLAEIENQRRRFEKDIKDAFEFGSFNFAKENLAILDNLQGQKKQLEMTKNLKRIKI